MMLKENNTVAMNEALKKIYVTHVNIRLSISFLLLKLASAELFAGVLMVTWLLGLAYYLHYVAIMQQIVRFGYGIFIFLVLIKTSLTLFLILQWLNEYYEISADMIKYRRGIIFRRVDDYPTADIKFIDVEQGIFG